MDPARIDHGSYISAVCTSVTGDLIAIGGAHSVDIIHIPCNDAAGSRMEAEVIRKFHIGCRITALAWSQGTTSPRTTEDWSIELVAACEDYSLHLLTADHTKGSEFDFTFGKGRSGHHGRVNDISYCGGDEKDRYVATVSDDRTLIIWDMKPPVTNPDDGQDEYTWQNSDRPQPTAFAHPYAQALKSVESHPTSSRDLLVADAAGNVVLTDWRIDDSLDPSRKNVSTELVHPRALADKVAGLGSRSGSVAWGSDNIVGGNYGSSLVLWDLQKNGKPTFTGLSFVEGGHRFRWCRTFPEYFAVSSASATKGALIHIWNANHVHGAPDPFPLAAKPLKVADFDFAGIPGQIPRIAAAVGSEVFIFALAE